MIDQFDASSRRNQSRDTAISFAIATGIALLTLAGLFVFNRTARDATKMASASQQDMLRSDRSKVADSNRPIDSDQRVVATRRTAEKEAANHGKTEPADPSFNPHSFVDASGKAADERSADSGSSTDTSSSSAKPESDERNPRRLLKKVRQQVKKGNSGEAISASNAIASLVEDPAKRSELEARLRDAEAAAGAGQLVDFDSLIQLIEQTISPNSWSSVGGAGTVQSFPGGVYVDTGGLVRARTMPAGSDELTRVRKESKPGSGPIQDSRNGTLRKVSLPRLEREVASRLASGQPLTDEIRYLAGLSEVQYVLVYPEEHDLILVGPAEDWMTDELGRVIGRKSGRPVLQLDDLVVTLRACFSEFSNHGLFGCGIYPRAECIVRVQEFLNRSAVGGPIDPSRRGAWLDELRDNLGPQDIQIFGVHPGSRVAHVLVEADYRMKLIGIGLEAAAVPGIPSYFELLGEPGEERLNRGLDTLRWWFTLSYDTILCSSKRDAFELRGNRVQIQSENELLTATGQRVHTGQSDPINAQFARNFTARFSDLAGQDPNFADLAGIFDLAVVSGLVRGHEINKAIDWPMITFLDPDEYVLPLNPSPHTVESVINHRVYRGRHILAAVSGGVHVNPWRVVSADNLRIDRDGSLDRIRKNDEPVDSDKRNWWWD